MRNALKMVLSLVIALLIVVFTNISAGETATVQKNFKKLANQLYEVTYDDYKTDFDVKKTARQRLQQRNFLGWVLCG